MRVVAGTARGRKLAAPEGRGTRPITDRAKEGIFNMIGSLGGVAGSQVVDLWAGSGSFGIEALSRGAERAVFVERGREALACLRTNLSNLGFDDRAEVVPSSVLAVVAGLAGPTRPDLVFCDPPYADDPWEELFGHLRPTVAPDGLVVCHAEREIAVPDGWAEVRRRDYGRARILIIGPTGEPVEGPGGEQRDVQISLQIAAERPDQPEVVALLEAHLAHARAASPPEHVHALDLDGLAGESVVFLTARAPADPGGAATDGPLLGIGALRLLGGARGELKSMHTAAEARGRGVGRALVEALLDRARSLGLTWVGLETGTMDQFEAARELYRSVGFTRCAPFGDYTDNPYSLCMAREL